MRIISDEEHRAICKSITESSEDNPMEIRQCVYEEFRKYPVSFQLVKRAIANGQAILIPDSTEPRTTAM